MTDRSRPPELPGSTEPALGEPQPPIIPANLDATLVLVRHGESEWVAEGLFQGQGDSPLSALGRRQAELVADRLAHPRRIPMLPVPLGGPAGIVHSPLARTTRTARTMQQAFAAEDAFARTIPRRAETGLLEIGQGEWEGLPGSVVAERWGTVLDGWRKDPLSAWAPGGESLAEVDARVRLTLAALLRRLADERSSGSLARSPVLGYSEPSSDEPWLVLVGHDGVFKVAVLALLGLPLTHFWSLPFALCGITVVELRAGRPRLRLHNATDHLGPLEDESALRQEAERRRSGAL